MRRSLPQVPRETETAPDDSGAWASERREGEAPTLAALRERLGAARGQEYWRSLEELADAPEFRALLEKEFPRHAAEWPRELCRRDFLSLIGAGLALAGLSSCTKQPPEPIVPYVRQPEELVPGRPLFFATAMAMGGLATGVLVESHEGRPTKIEGNPDHPASLGATDLYSQASILDLYDPDRSQVLLGNGEASSWSEFLRLAQSVLAEQRRQRGTGLRLLTDTVSSPTLVQQLRALLSELPEARWHSWEPLTRDAERLGARQAFGVEVATRYQLDRADCVLSIDADFLSCWPGSLRYTRDFARRRRPESGAPVRLYALLTTPSNTSAVADHRLPLRPSEVEGVVQALAVALGVGPAADVEPLGTAQAHFVAALARDLLAHRGTSLIMVGESQPPSVHALAHAMNHALGNIGSTVIHTEPPVSAPAPQLESLRSLADDLAAGRVDVLLILDGSGGVNPAYSGPADLELAARIEKARLSIHLGPYFDETAARCHWHIPAAHYLESWGDARAYDGTVSIVQPLIAPLYGGRTAHEVLAAFSDAPQRSTYELVRSYWQGQHPAADFERFFRQALDRGVIPDTQAPPRSVTLQPLTLSRPTPPAAEPPALAKAGRVALEVVFRGEPGVHDGRFANNGWLQELPRPLTRLAWDNVAILSPRTAQRLDVDHKEKLGGRQSGADLVEITLRGRTIVAPVWIQPGQPDGCITLTLGYGRTRAGRVGSERGYDAYRLRTSDALWSARGALVRKLGERHRLASTQLHFLMEGRELVRSATVAEYEREPQRVHHGAEAEPPRSLTLYPEHPYPGHAWGMAIDLSACVGCGACVLACQAENNIPVVGKEQVARGRLMHWLRIDHYYRGETSDPESYFQPVPCMHCENAPCEIVCPVAATVHSAEGLNDMVYNRCIGTRYCSNNCPYKVRRFNFLLYWDEREPTVLQKNPNVTVRSRGVMEKCTYCVQRISEARIRAEQEERRIRDGEVQTACQAACPAEAIIFGDLNDPASRVTQAKKLPRDYALLGELNTRPRTTYQAAVRNPNPELDARKEG